MESGQRIGDRYFFRRIGSDVIDNIFYHIDERMENTEYPDDPEEVEYEVGKCRPACLCVTGQCRNVGGYRCSDIFSHHQCDTQIQVENSART